MSRTKEVDTARILATAIVDVDASDVELVEAVAAIGEGASMSDVVAAEIRSNLESIRYVRTVIVNAR